MKHDDFKARAVSSLECFREEFTTKQLALELYEIYELKSPVQSWIAHINACFNPNKPEFFHWCDIVNLCRITGQWEPINFMCDELGLERPKQIDRTAMITQMRARRNCLAQELKKMDSQIELLHENLHEEQGTRFSRSE
jgi:hypothetical protein